MDVPSELAALDQWVCWKLTKRRGKTTKVPHSAHTGSVCSVTDPEAWTSLDDAVDGQQRWGLDGVGFVFTADDPYCGVDLDHCVDEGGEIHPAAMAIIDYLDSYAEVSPSGTGVHCIVKAQLGQGRRTGDTEWGGNFEAYDQGRYFTFTGRALNGSDIRESAMAIEVKDDNDVRVIEKCRKHASGFELLFDDGDCSEYEDDHSRADLALANMIAARTQDPVQVERIMRRSALAREKWDHPDTGSTWLMRRVVEPAIRDASKGGSDRTSFWSGDFEKDVAQQMYMLAVRDEARVRYQEEHTREFPYPTKEWSLADELALPPRDQVWRVDGLQQIHANVVLIAGYKLGKTTLCMNLIRSLVDGTTFLGEYDVEQIEGNVAVFNYELDPDQWVDWARDMKLKHPEKVKPFHLRGLGALRFWLPQVQDKLVEWMLENDIRYWVLDPTAQAWDTLLESEGDNIRAAQFTRAIDTVKQRAGIGETNLTHHTSRASQDQARGPSALEGWYDAGWFLTGKRDALMFHATGRDVDVPPVTVEYHQDRTRSMLLDHRDEKEKVQVKKETKRTALEVLTELGPLSQSALAKELKNRGCGVSGTKAGALFQSWVGAADNPMSVRQVGQVKTYYLKGVEGHE